VGTTCSLYNVNITNLLKSSYNIFAELIMNKDEQMAGHNGGEVEKN
jgi:ureidoglycolate hydrolase